MSVLCGWGSIDERGRISGGKAGDQTGKEVKTGPWYYFGQNAVYRWKDRKKAAAYAAVIRALCNNPKIGYDQSQRSTLFTLLKQNDWNYKKVDKLCETDCSALAGAGVNCVTKRASIPSWVYTGNLDELLMNTGLFKKLTASKYTQQSAYLMAGDIINNPEKHVIVCLQDGPKASAPASTGTSAVNDLIKTGQKGLNKMLGGAIKVSGTRDAATRKLEIMAIQYGLNKKYRMKLNVNGDFDKVTRGALANKWVEYGEENLLVRAVQCLLYTHGYNAKGIDSHFGPGMLAAVKAYQRKAGLEVDGVAGPKTISRLLG